MSRTSWLSSIFAPNGFNGDRCAQHLCLDHVSGELFVVWQDAAGHTGFYRWPADLTQRYLAWVVEYLADGRMELLSGPAIPATV